MNCHIIVLERPTNLLIVVIFDGNVSPVSYYHSLSLCQRTVNCDVFLSIGEQQQSLLFYTFFTIFILHFFKGDKK